MSVTRLSVLIFYVGTLLGDNLKQIWGHFDDQGNLKNFCLVKKFKISSHQLVPLLNFYPDLHYY